MSARVWVLSRKTGEDEPLGAPIYVDGRAVILDPSALPEDRVERAARAMCELDSSRAATTAWTRITEAQREFYRKSACAALVEGLSTALTPEGDAT